MDRYTQVLVRSLEPLVVLPVGVSAERADREIRLACEVAMERLHEPFADPGRAACRLFGQVRFCFPLERQARVRVLIDTVVGAAAREVARRPRRVAGEDGQPVRCPVSTRRGTACKREPLANGYCPSHQHLVEDRVHGTRVLAGV